MISAEELPGGDLFAEGLLAEGYSGEDLLTEYKCGGQHYAKGVSATEPAAREPYAEGYFTEQHSFLAGDVAHGVPSTQGPTSYMSLSHGDDPSMLGLSQIPTGQPLVPSYNEGPVSLSRNDIDEINGQAHDYFSRTDQQVVSRALEDAAPASHRPTEPEISDHMSLQASIRPLARPQRASRRRAITQGPDHHETRWVDGAFEHSSNGKDWRKSRNTRVLFQVTKLTGQQFPPSNIRQ